MAAISDGTMCCVCAEPLEWTAFGVCNHKDTCSKCVARWRFVLKDNTCMVCKTELSSVYITRFMGDFTARLTQQDFDDLKARTDRGELYYLPSIGGYTDDQAHYQLIKSLCGYTHPLIEEKCAVAQRAPPKFSSFEAMKGFIQNNCKLQFCNICVEGRKVFLCEQQLYTRFDLDKHNKTGDDEGPLAESGFKGHPMCHFCRTRFYDSNELYRHMESSHEHCFICRRERPHQHVYYRHYKELEDHFRQDHFICPHPACLEARFVVFPTEHEMKRHFANEHGDELKMSRAQRREAMTIPVNLQFRSSAEEEARTAALARPGVVIGGGYNLAAPRRGGGGRGGPPPSLHHSSSEGQMQAALQASIEQGPSSVMFDASDFPAVSGGSGGPGGQFGRWSGIGGSGSSSVLNHEEFPELPTMSKAQKKRMRQQMPLAAQLRAANMPVRVINRSAGAGPSGGGSSSSGAAGGGSSSGAQQLPDDPFPQLTAGPSRGGSGSGARHLGGQAAVRQQDVLAAQQERRSQQQQQQQKQRQQNNRRPLLPRTPDLDASSGNEASSAEDEESTPLEYAVSGPSSAARGRPDGGGRGVSTLGTSMGWDGGRLASGLAPSRSPPPPARVEDEFPSLAPSSAARNRGARPPVPPPAPLHYEAVAGTPAGRQGSSSAGVGAQQQQQQPVVGPEDFPSLGGGPNVRPLSAGQWQQKSKKAGAKGPSSSNGTSSSSNRPSTAHSHVAPPPGSPKSPSANRGSYNGAGNEEAGSGAEQGGGGSVSDRLKAANKALISKIRTQLGGDGAQFSRFKAESGLFMRGELMPEQYHSSIVALGLLPVVSELAALCPGAEQRSELLRAHREYLASPAANNAGPGWVPPEAAAAMAAEAESRASWSCKRCTLVNAPEVSACEMCGATREGVIPSLDAFPSLPSSSGASSSTRATQGSTADGLSPASSAKGSKQRGKGGTKITIGLGSGNARAAAEAVTADPSKVAWGGAGNGGSNSNAALRQAAQAQREALARPNGVRGQWAQSSANNLARQIGIMNDAWGSR